jgi:hypothetical protein
MATGDPVLTLGKAVTLRRAAPGEREWWVEGSVPLQKLTLLQEDKHMLVFTWHVLKIFTAPRRLGPNHIIATYIGSVDL